MAGHRQAISRMSFFIQPIFRPIYNFIITTFHCQGGSQGEGISARAFGDLPWHVLVRRRHWSFGVRVMANVMFLRGLLCGVKIVFCWKMIKTSVDGRGVFAENGALGANVTRGFFLS